MSAPCVVVPVATADLAAMAAPYNPRVMDDHDLAALRRSLRYFGAVEPIVVNRRSGRIVGGHQRVRAAQAEGLAELPVVYVDLDDPSEKQLNVALNRIHGRWDDAKLDALLADLAAAGADLALTGFTEDELAALLRPPSKGLTDPDAVPALPEAAATRPGDLIRLGRHRLLCGDATCAADVARLCEGVTPLLMVTDPPYGVEYDPTWRHRAGVNRSARVGAVANDARADWREAWALFPGDVAYVWHGALHASTVAESLAACGFAVRAQIVWAKERFAISRGHYHWQHEPCWYAVRSGGTGHWSGGRRQTTLWTISGAGQDTDTVHGAQKPVECMRRPIENNSSPGQAVYDPFVGSGTTLIAAEMAGRSALALEIDPRYVDVAVARWEAFTGQAAERPAREA